MYALVLKLIIPNRSYGLSKIAIIITVHMYMINSFNVNTVTKIINL